MAFNLRSDTKRLICLAVLLGSYLLSGAAVFRILENDNDKIEIQDLNAIREYIMAKHNMSREQFSFFATKIEEAIRNRCDFNSKFWCETRWSYYESLYFTWSVVTTIGYGHLAPSTPGGRIFCMIFALFGVPLNLMVLKHIGDRVHEWIHDLHYYIETHVMGREVKTLATKKLVWTLVLLLVMLFLGAVLYSQTEHWSFLDGVYFCFVTFATIGFGDLVPNKGTAPQGAFAICMEVLRGLFILLGLSMFFSIVTSILTASEQLRENFSAENSDARLDEKSAPSVESEQTDTKQLKTGTEDVESESIDDR